MKPTLAEQTLINMKTLRSQVVDKLVILEEQIKHQEQVCIDERDKALRAEIGLPEIKP